MGLQVLHICRVEPFTGRHLADLHLRSIRHVVVIDENLLFRLLELLAKLLV
jgi:hypothetical protein